MVGVQGQAGCQGNRHRSNKEKEKARQQEGTCARSHSPKL